MYDWIARIAAIDWRGWLRWSLVPATYLGFATIALTWGGIETALHSDRARVQNTAIQDTTNLARLFEDHIIRYLKSNDRLLRALQLASVQGTLSEEYDRLAIDVSDANEFTSQLTIIGADGFPVASTFGPVSDMPNFSDRDHFSVHAKSDDAGLFISTPVLGRVSNKWTIQLTRRLRGGHGEFAGVAVASVYADKLTRLYEVVDLGPGGAINLVGRDGIVRASGGMKVDNVGDSMKVSDLLKRVAVDDEGWFTATGWIDGIKRIVSYRAVDGFPLVLTVGRAEAAIFHRYQERALLFRLCGAGFSFFVLMVLTVNACHNRGLRRALDRQQASEERARETSRELQLTLDHMGQGIVMIDAKHNIALVNRQATRLLGLPEDFVAVRPKYEAVLALQKQKGEFGPGSVIDPQVRSFIDAGGLNTDLAVYERQRPDGTVLEVRSFPLPDGGFVRTFTDITDRKRSAQKIAHMAHHDALTGLANRVLLREQMTTALARQKRNGESFSLLLIDLDRFKAVNDTLGHRAGDGLLKKVAQRLRACVREIDTVARLGGDEFAILQVATENRDNVETLARRIIEVVSASYTVDGSPVAIGASIGIARSHDTPDLEQLFHNADLALYRVKAEGRNSFRLFEPEMDATARERRQLEAELREARDRGEFEVHYQPIVNIATGRIASVEALLRWNHPVRGLLSPAQFIPIAEEIGVMSVMDRWAMETACADATHWPEDIRVAVNFSPSKFKKRTLVDVVCHALESTGLPPHRLELEISERLLLQEEEGNLTLLRALRALGAKLVLDDFGVGNSSLSDLRAFRFDTVKIDQSFVREMEGHSESAAIVAAIVGLGRSLGMETTAEGIETERQAELVRAAGCTQAQGYLYSRPVTARAIAALLREQQVKPQAVA